MFQIMILFTDRQGLWLKRFYTFEMTLNLVAFKSWLTLHFAEIINSKFTFPMTPWFPREFSRGPVFKVDKIKFMCSIMPCLALFHLTFKDYDGLIIELITLPWICGRNKICRTVRLGHRVCCRTFPWLIEHWCVHNQSDNRIYWNINEYIIEKIINLQHVTCFTFQPTKRFHFKYNYWLRLKLSELLKNEKLLKFQCRNENLITIHTIELLHTRNFEWQDFL